MTDEVVESILGELAGSAFGVPGAYSAVKGAMSAAASPDSSSSNTPRAVYVFSSPIPPVLFKLTRKSLQQTRPSDYNSKCKHCSKTIKPYSEGPHHEPGCPRLYPVFLLNSEPAHRRKCQHCEARPFVAGEHHRRDCPRRIKHHMNYSVGGFDYSTKCTHCGVKPYSQGPHHGKDCKRNWKYPAYATKKAHNNYCKHCEARPFPAGPHHQHDCPRHII